MFVREAFRKLCSDAHFMTLLRAEGLETIRAQVLSVIVEAKHQSGEH